MSVESTTRKIIYSGNGTTTEWPVPFAYSSTEHLKLTVADAQGNETAVTSNYTVQVSEQGETSILYPASGSPLAAGNKLVIYRETPLTQVVDLEYGGAFSPDVLEHDGFDREVMMIQEMREEVDRAVKVKLSSSETPDELRDAIFAARDAAAESASDASDSAGAAADSATLAQAWAESPTPPDPNDPDSKSAKTWAGESASSASAASGSAGDASASATLAQAWAESPTPPDPNDPTSKSAKEWARVASDNVPIATTAYPGKVMPDGSSVEVAADGTISVPKATAAAKGIVKPDGKTIFVDADGAIHGPSRNPGEIIYSLLPLTDAGLHLVDGTLLSGSGIYADFVDYIIDLYDSGDHTTLFETEANWQASVTSYGVCGKFVVDKVNDTVRLPKVTGFMQGTVVESAIGDLVEAGLPNINVSGSDSGIYVSALKTPANELFTSSAAVSANNYVYNSTSNNNFNIQTLTFDASEANTIYGNSTTVQPQAIKGYVYIVVANSTKTEIEVDIDDVVTDLNGKADVDLTNATPTANFADALDDAGIRTVVETWHSGTEWYRVWSDGWIEQGGAHSSTGSPLSINLNKVFSDTKYTLIILDFDTGGNSTHVSVTAKTTALFSYTRTQNAVTYNSWFACGY